MSNKMAELENSWITKFMGIGRYLNKFFNLAPFLGGATKADRDRYNRLLKNIACLLQEAGVDFGYLYEKEMYSGALAFDQGADKAFISHAKKVAEMFRKNNVKTVITVDLDASSEPVHKIKFSWYSVFSVSSRPSTSNLTFCKMPCPLLMG